MRWISEHQADAAVYGFTAIAGIICLIVWWKNSRDKVSIVTRILATIVMGGALLPSMFHPRSLIATLLDMMCLGLGMACIWGRYFIEIFAGMFGNLYDGGDQQVDPKPFFSIFRKKRNDGKYFEALAEIRKQIAKFPTDFEAQNFLAELQAENLNDLPGAELTIDRLCAQPQRVPGEIAFALNRLADWHLNLTKDRDSAQRALEKIIELLPESEMSLRASQRVAHLADNQLLLASVDRPRHEVKKGIQNLGLVRGPTGKLRVPEVDPAKQAAEYVAQLEKHPLDTHAREKLAVIYAEHFHRLDMAIDQLEQMISQPNHTHKQVTHWLNVMADLQVKENAPLPEVQATLHRIMELDPNSAAAQLAHRRLDRLQLELRGKTVNRGVQLGEYEQNIGLKRKRV